MKTQYKIEDLISSALAVDILMCRECTSFAFCEHHLNLIDAEAELFNQLENTTRTPEDNQ